MIVKLTFCMFFLEKLISSPSDQERHEAVTGSSPDIGGRRSRPFNEAVVVYEQFMSREKAMGWGDKAATTLDQDESEGAVPGAEEVDDPSLTVPKELQLQVEDFSFPSYRPEGVIMREDLAGLTHTFHLPIGQKVLIPRASDGPAYPSSAYVAISSHYLIAGLRFLLPYFLIRVPNLLELALMKFTPNAYTWLISFYLIFRRKGVGSSTDNIIRH
ncbi:hypothetical protein ACOSQ3_009974 [Xanthoceras sorbifolium]